MKKLVLLLGALALFGCGEKNESGAGAVEAADSSADSQETGNQTEESSADSEELVDNGIALPLSDADVERLLKEAIDIDSLEQRDDLLYQNNEPFSGWIKMEADDEGVMVGLVKSGKANGPWCALHEDGRKMVEGLYKDGKKDGPWTFYKDDGLKKFMEQTHKDGEYVRLRYWHDNGKKRVEVIMKDGKKISEKFWNSGGIEVETREESTK
ncbi:hypothetical protein OAL42_02230 [Akkermansiaceae bacterium]|nr:hypothetical protein [Akkermansiaceae bacterium]